MTIKLLEAPSQLLRTMDLNNNEIHVWKISLSEDSLPPDQFRGILSPVEADRANAFRFKKDQLLSVASRGWLRTILGNYTGYRPEALVFDYGTHGKPNLASEELKWLQFNVSHSRDWILIAVTKNHEIGVDVEFVDNQIEVDHLAKVVFSEAETTLLSSLPSELKCRGFFEGWTRKEAYLKARGHGFFAQPKQISVTLHPQEPARLLADSSDPNAIASAFLSSLAVHPGYAAAVASLNYS